MGGCRPPGLPSYFSAGGFSDCWRASLLIMFLSLWKFDHSPCRGACNMTPPSTHPTLIREKTANNRMAKFRILGQCNTLELAGCNWEQMGYDSPL